MKVTVERISINKNIRHKDNNNLPDTVSQWELPSSSRTNSDQKRLVWVVSLKEENAEAYKY